MRPWLHVRRKPLCEQYRTLHVRPAPTACQLAALGAFSQQAHLTASASSADVQPKGMTAALLTSATTCWSY